MKRILTFLTLLCGAAQMLPAQDVCIYRNDGRFHKISVPDTGVSLTHRLPQGEPPVLAAADGEQIPLEAIDSCVVRLTDIPTLRFTLDDFPQQQWVTSKTDYIVAHLQVEGAGYCASASDLTLSVKGRGNSSWTLPKKPMRLKFASKISLLGLPKAKSFVLLADYVDPTLMRNAVAHWIAREVGADSPCHTAPCHVWVNGHYAGAYLLATKVGINKASVDIDDSKGVLLEMSTEFDEDYKFRSSIHNLPVMVKDPDLPDVTSNPDSLLALWQDDFNAAELLATQGRGGECFDLQSLARYILVCSVMANNEIGFPKSVYLYKDSLGGEAKYKFGPLWDFDVSTCIMHIPAGAAEPELKIGYGPVWLNRLFRTLVNETPGFIDIYRDELLRYASDIHPRVHEFVDTYAALIEPSALLDGQRWPQSGQIGTWLYRDNAFDRRRHVDDLHLWLDLQLEALLEALEKGEL